MLLEEGSLPSSIISVIEGEVCANKKNSLETNTQSKASKSVNNTRQKVISGGYGALCTTLVGTHSNLITVGLECPLLQMLSPFTYVSRTPLVALYVSLENVLRLYESVYPRIVVTLKHSLEEKFRHLASLSHSGEHAQKARTEATAELKKEKAE